MMFAVQNLTAKLSVLKVIAELIKAVRIEVITEDITEVIKVIMHTCQGS
jgi:hypothetical protein